MVALVTSMRSDGLSGYQVDPNTLLSAIQSPLKNIACGEAKKWLSTGELLSQRFCTTPEESGNCTTLLVQAGVSYMVENVNMRSASLPNSLLLKVMGWFTWNESV